MPTEILMPALSPTMTEGNLAKWLKKEGDEIRSGDIIAEIETDKATMEVEAVDEGTLGRILVPEGTEAVKVNQPIALLLGEGEDASSLSEGAERAPKAEAKPEPSKPAEPPKAESKPAAAPAPGGNGHAEGERIFASPLAKRMAELAGIELSGIQGSGPHGRIVKADIEKAQQGGAPKAAVTTGPHARAPEAARPAAAPAPAAPAPAAAIGAPTAPHREVALSSMRKVIARRLTEAKQTIPHFYLSVDVELDALLKLRADLNGRKGADYKLSVNDLVIKAVAIAIRQKPAVNAYWGGDKVYELEDIDVSVAVAIDGGLITPIVRKADQKGLATISSEMKDLATRAKAGKLKPEEYQGGGFSISNLGMYGIKEFAAVINPPQSCILAVGAGEKRPVVKDNALAIATVMTVTLSIDHRVVDGALGAEWLQAFKALVEDPISLML
ncbi:MAG TPA: pyruvate dehydrogenase complex dihydrolipoamide acetyltransferase [Geminicoccaceae bacterium]|nr:pyruvate dehydrogenase complex dihydrolipoamide acetyltransferase [Geminicoccus sp.]HMU52719.1 pyruvate dehydrogenase complex dihydrolipoamide acetyltransferase [Geminicoccaceae bacterium]